MGNEQDIISKISLIDDLKHLSDEERQAYYVAVCESVGLNPLTKPLDYIDLKYYDKESKQYKTRMVLYAKRDATDQLRRIHGVSIEITMRQKIEGVYMVTAKAVMRNEAGNIIREDEAMGVVALQTGKGEELSPSAMANAMMACETKAKRRVTLSICGLGLLDESEIEDANRAATETAHKEEDDDPLGDDSAASWKEYEKKAKASKSKEELDKLNDLAKKITDPALRTKAQRLYSQLRKKFTEQTAAPESKDPEQEETA